MARADATLMNSSNACLALLSYPPWLGKRLILAEKLPRLPWRARSQLSLFLRDPIEKRIKLVGLGSFGGKTRLNARNGLGEHAR